MAWTAPITWASASVLTAAQMNTEVRDHHIWMKAFADLITNSTAADSGVSTYLRIVRDVAANAAYQSWVTSEAGYRLQVTGGGTHTWSDGTDPGSRDVSLARSAAGRLLMTGDGITANEPQFGVDYNGVSGQYNAIFVRLTGDTQPKVSLGVNGSGYPSVLFGVGGSTAPDVTMTREAAGRVLVSATSGHARVGSLLGDDSTDANSFYAWVAGDSIPRARMGQDGGGRPSIAMGAGGANALDAFLDRDAAGVFGVRDTVMRGYRAAAANGTFVGRVTGDGADQFILYAGGRGFFGDGITTLTKAGVVEDADFRTTPVSGTIALDTTNSDLYVRVGGTWKSVALT